jgi:hypothetical protein
MPDRVTTMSNTAQFRLREKIMLVKWKNVPEYVAVGPVKFGLPALQCQAGRSRRYVR